MNIDDLTYGQIRQIVNMFSNQSTTLSSESALIDQHVVVRTYSAGVHIGTLIRKDGENVLLKDARRLWKWAGAFTLSEVSQTGVQKSGSRIACVVPLIELTNVNEIIPTTEKARATFDACHE